MTLDLCPTSNIQAANYPSLSAHPLARLARAGVPVTLSTDDRTVSDLTLVKEYSECARTHGLSAGELWAINMHALRVAFLHLDESLRAGLIAEFKDFADIGAVARRSSCSLRAPSSTTPSTRGRTTRRRWKRSVRSWRSDAPRAETLLDVACGTGHHMELLREWFTVEGVDLEPGLLEVARSRLPGVPLHLGDMRTFNLGRQFDVVTCLFSSIGYMQTPEDLLHALVNMAGHLAPDGVMLVEPWLSRMGSIRTTSQSPLVAEGDGFVIVRMNDSRVEGKILDHALPLPRWSAGESRPLHRGALARPLLGGRIRGRVRGGRAGRFARSRGIDGPRPLDRPSRSLIAAGRCRSRYRLHH